MNVTDVLELDREALDGDGGRTPIPDWPKRPMAYPT